MAEQQTTYRVATINPGAGRRWTLHAPEFGTEREAEVWATVRLFPGGAGVRWGGGTSGLHVGGRKRSTTAAIVRVVEGVPQVPPWMALEHQEDEGPDGAADGAAVLARARARGGGGEDMSSVEEVRAALEQAIRAAEGIVVLEVRRPGHAAVRTRCAQITWAALWDALALDPQDDEGEAEQTT